MTLLSIIPIACMVAVTPTLPLPMDMDLTVASIVAGEVGTTVPTARMPVACTVVRDWRRGLDLRQRWYGWGKPTPADLSAARKALSGGCSGLPYFRFLGNESDLRIWRANGWVADDDLWYWHSGEHVAVGVVE